jgi:hypothetical protein
MKIIGANPHKLAHVNHREFTPPSECVYVGSPNTEQVCNLLHRKEAFLNVLFRILLRAWHTCVDHHREAGKKQHEFTEDSRHCFRRQCSRAFRCLEKVPKARAHGLDLGAQCGEAAC